MSGLDAYFDGLDSQVQGLKDGVTSGLFQSRIDAYNAELASLETAGEKVVYDDLKAKLYASGDMLTPDEILEKRAEMNRTPYGRALFNRNTYQGFQNAGESYIAESGGV